ncbi:MAG: U32 family peptidase [Bacteroidales bacterium]|nr:U32 family peptidase [Bacteroidales bacterium]MCF8403254.1 U32 family peptidase [Bacteroidales bacterium]
MTAKDIEIMAPVGSYESLHAAIQGGADSVYFGIGHLNMRSKSSKNFTLDDLSVISNIAKENNIKTYITLNTVVYDEELEEMKAIVDAAKKNSISAIIASDQSVIQYAREEGVEVHMSTQTNITNIGAVKFWSQFADVMVTARELNLNQVATITKAIEEQQIKGPSGNLVQIEVFAHGALCMAVSGKCYLSLDNLNSSANRGACLQQCRRPYHVTDDDGIELLVDNEYIMSPKDLKTLDFLDKILAAGVRVLKIEGRGRSADYVKTVTRVYREAVNAWFEGEFTKEKLELWNIELGTVYNRGFWDGYYMGKKMGEWTEQYGSLATKKKIYIGKVTNYFSKLGVAEIKMETHDLSIGEEIKIMGPTTGVYEDIVAEIRVDLKKVKRTIKGEDCSLPTKELVRRGDKVYKVVKVKEEF